MFFKPNRANRLDIHWNSKKHLDEVAGAAAGEQPAAAEEAKQAEGDQPAEPEIEPTYETERRHENVSAFKKAMGLHVDNFKLNYATKLI